MARTFGAWCLAACVAGTAWAGQSAPPPVPPAPRVPVLVELFTSEGCSSCPPADRLLAGLIGEQPVPGALVIGLSEHVDYWDHQGWRDPFSSAVFTRRQQVYAGRFGSDRLFTPQLVVDGRSDCVGSDRAEALARIRKAAASGKAPVDLAWACADRRTIRVQVPPGGAARANVWLVIVEDGLSSVVKGGENGGRTLPHAAVARRLKTIGETAGDGAFSAEPAVDLDPAWHAPSVSAVVFVEDRRSGAILGAAAMHR